MVLGCRGCGRLIHKPHSRLCPLARVSGAGFAVQIGQCDEWEDAADPVVIYRNEGRECRLTTASQAKLRAGLKSL